MKIGKTLQVQVSVSNDLLTDNRVHKTCCSLQKFGYSVKLTGRKLPNSQPIKDRNYPTQRMALIFKKGPCFYAELNTRLFFLLMFSKADILLANDLDTLPANYLAAKLKSIPLVFDSHEYFTEVPELIGRPRVQKTWKKIEQHIVPQLKHAYTVCGSIAQLFNQEYNTSFKVVRNIPVKQADKPIPHDKLINDSHKIILYQGALNIGRGLPQLLDAMPFVDNALLLVAGDGDIAAQLKKQAQTLNLGSKVQFLGRLPLEEIQYITRQAHLGLSIEEDLGLNYRFALPNKLFDYIQAQVPVLVSNLPEMSKIVKGYSIGMILASHEPKAIGEALAEALNNESLRKTWAENLQIAAKELTWENEEKTLEEIFSGAANE